MQTQQRNKIWNHVSPVENEITQTETPLSDAINNDKPKPKSAEQYINDVQRRLELAQKRARGLKQR